MTHTTEKKDAVITMARDGVTGLHADALLFPGGIAALARLVGRSPGVMHNKFSDAEDRYEVTDREADVLAKAIRARTGRNSYMESKCADHGGVFVPLPEGVSGEDDVLEAYMEIIQQMGDLSREFTEARADGVIEPREFSALELRARRTIAAVQHFMADLKTQVREIPVDMPSGPVRAA